jgi:hypothetical protein
VLQQHQSGHDAQNAQDPRRPGRAGFVQGHDGTPKE